MGILLKKKPTVWFYVYRGVNYSKKEVYFGVSKDPASRKDGAHCKGGTIALKRWNCEKDTIRWFLVSKHFTQTAASTRAHLLERTYKHSKGFKVIKTAGV